MLFVVFFVTSVNAQTEPANYTAAVNNFKLFYNSDQPDSIYKTFGPEMRNALTPDQFRATSKQLKGQLENLQQTIFTSYTQPVAIYKASFQNGDLELKISLNNENKIIGLLLSPLTQPGKQADPSTGDRP